MPKIPNFAWILGLIQAAIAAAAPVLSANQHGGLIAVIAVIGAIATAVVAYLNSKKSVAAGVRAAAAKRP